MRRAIWIALAFLILYAQFGLHEFGHFHMARLNNVPVREFSLGIGPAIYQRQMGETLFSIRIVPVGAYNDFSEDGARVISALPLKERLLISVMGIVNNLASSLVLVFLIQFLGVLTGRFGFKAFLWEIAVTPFRLFWMVVRLAVEIFSFGKKSVEGVGVYRLPFEWVRGSYFMSCANFFILLGFILGLSNILPLVPLDGGRLFLELLMIAGVPDNLLVLFVVAGPIVFMIIMLTSFFFRVNTNFAMFDNQEVPIDQKDAEDIKKSDESEIGESSKK